MFFLDKYFASSEKSSTFALAFALKSTKAQKSDL